MIIIGYCGICMEEISVKGIILAAAPQGEYGRRLTLLTDRLGRITAFASGAAKAGSHIMGSTRPLTCAAFDLAKGRSAWNLHSVRVIDAFADLSQDVDVSFYAMYILELGEYFSESGMPEEEAKMLLNLMFMTFKAFRDKDLTPELVRRIFELRLLKLQGEYTTEPSAQAEEPVRALWHHALTMPLTSLYAADRIGAMTEDTAGSADEFADCVDRLFRRQNAHSFRSLKVLEQM